MSRRRKPLPETLGSFVLLDEEEPNVEATSDIDRVDDDAHRDVNEEEDSAK